MTVRYPLDVAIEAASVQELPDFDVWDGNALDVITDVLETPRPIGEVEAVEAWIKRTWMKACEKLDDPIRARFAEFFLKLGVLPKYKSYGVKYATPFGYSLFDLNNGGGFSIQVHEADKIEAFHVLRTHSQAFVLLCSRAEWSEHGSDMVAQWQSGHPEQSFLAYRPVPGDIAVVEDLGTVHTVVGCLVEEFATSSYDVVSRLHDQNLHAKVRLPESHRGLHAILGEATELKPRRRVGRREDWWISEISQEDAEIVDLPNKGLAARHLKVGDEESISGRVSNSLVTSLIVLSGSVQLNVGEVRLNLRAGDTTSLAPDTAYSVVGARGESRLSQCEVAVDLAFADLR